MAQNNPSPKITISGNEYDFDALTDQAKVQLQNIQFCDGQINQLQSEWAVADTARMAYSAALKREFSSQKA
jgi:hypothetical protein